ncbi:serine hydrolase domain-containing protein [uncultured Croceitalea sp.]|uniref:serine hydrolase domain-containing protein n=1 Tax=uncultured Croceitalea sp. TaxID=1798908 RepID=UPI00374F873E
MKNSLKLLTVLLLISNFNFGQDISQKIDSIIKSTYENNPNIGISVGFINNNEEFYTAYGKLNKESQIDINKNTIFELGSITKVLTSNLIAQAVIENKLNLNDFIDDYLPKQYVLNKNLMHKIKISDLASHQSGLPDLDLRKLVKLNPQQYVSTVTKNTLSIMINNCSELTDYGIYRYNNLSYALLGQILENIYNKSYDEIIHEKIINPLQLSNTLTKNFNVKHITTGHNPRGGNQELVKWNDFIAPAGLVKSNASDMIIFLKAVLNQEHTIAKAAMITEKIFYKDENREVGLGTWMITDESNTVYIKLGSSLGQSSIMFYNRDKNWGIIILLDQGNSKLREKLYNDIYETVLK